MDQASPPNGALAIVNSHNTATTTTITTSPSIASRSGNDTDIFLTICHASSNNGSPSNSPPPGLLDRIKSLSFGRFKKQPLPLSSKSSPSTPTAEADEKQSNTKHGRKRRILSHLCASISSDSEQEASIICEGENVISLSHHPEESSSNGQISRPLYPTNLMIVDKTNSRIEFTPNSLPMVSLTNQVISSNEPNNSEIGQLEAVLEASSPGLIRSPELSLALRSQLAMSASPYPYLAKWNDPGISLDQIVPVPSQVSSSFANSSSLITFDGRTIHRVHTQIDFAHRFVPGLLEITNFPFYWGKMDRYEAEKLLENKPEGTFLLRDSAQEDHLFSVSFRRFHRSLHARIEQSNDKFSFDSHDPGVYSSTTVCGLIEHYKDPNHCMFFEPMLTLPLNRNFPFSLQHLARAAICSKITYDSVHYLPLPKRLKLFLQEYHYKQKVNVRRFD